jgi:uncharacterized protein (TIGR03437 family)
MYSTILAGVIEAPTDLVIDGHDNLWISGSGDLGLPLVAPIQASVGSFLSEYSPSVSLEFSTYFDAGIAGLTVTSSGSVWLAGQGRGDRFPFVASAISGPPACSAGGSGYVARIDPTPPPVEPGVPQITAIYNAASYELGDVVAPGEIVTIFGSSLAPGAQSAATTPLPVSLNGVTVTIGGMPAPLFYVSPPQINLQVPYGVSLGAGDLVITTNGQSITRRVCMVALRPGIFVVTHASDFSLVTAQHPATAGEYLAIFATGLGPTNPSVPAGAVNPLAVAPLQSSASVIVGALGGGLEVQPSYVGLAPGIVGIYQINFQLAGASPGRNGVVVSIGGSGSSTNLVPVDVR